MYMHAQIALRRWKCRRSRTTIFPTIDRMNRILHSVSRIALLLGWYLTNPFHKWLATRRPAEATNDGRSPSPRPSFHEPRRKLPSEEGIARPHPSPLPQGEGDSFAGTAVHGDDAHPAIDVEAPHGRGRIAGHFSCERTLLISEYHLANGILERFKEFFNRLNPHRERGVYAVATVQNRIPLKRAKARAPFSGNSFHTFALVFLLAASFGYANEDFSSKNARATQAWVRDAVIYEIFPRNFSAEGNFDGVTAKLDELKTLGVDVLWLMPIHPIGEKFRKGTLGSPYAIKDYYGINTDYGTTNDFKRLVSEAHKRGLKVILDLVANHTAWDNVMMAQPAFYKQDANGKVTPPVPEWTDVAGLNYANPKLREYMIAMMKYWITEFDVDGYRCDVAYMVPTDFWEQARAELEKAKPSVLMLAEASKPELLLKAFDMDYSWPLHGTLNKVMLEGVPASEFRRSWEESAKQFPRGSLHLRISDNHDEARAVSRFGLRGALAAQALMLTLDGIPLLYNGMEVGDATESGDPALFGKMPIFWSPKERPKLRETYTELIKLRKKYAAFRNDRVVWLRSSNEADLVTFMRLDEKDEFVVVINVSSRPQIGWVEVMHDHEFKAIKFPGMPELPANGFPMFRLNGYEWRVYHRGISR